MLPIFSRRYKNPFYRIAFFLFLSTLVSGCATEAVRKTSIERATNSIELTSTPFYPQSRYQCGPAALATVLNATGLGIDPVNLADEVYLPNRRGTLQVELITAVRRNGRVPYQTGQKLQLVLDQLNDGLPVLVLMNLGIKLLPVYHYAVVIGYDAESDEIILRSGTNNRKLMSRKRFLSAWQRSGSWALTVLPPGKLPAQVDIRRYLRSIIELETIGQWPAAEVSYLAVLQRWPTNTLARFGLANTLRAQGKLNEAIDQYRLVLNNDAAHKPARNNLADSLLKLGQCEEATATLDRVFISSNPKSAIDRSIQATLAEIQVACSNSRLME